MKKISNRNKFLGIASLVFIVGLVFFIFPTLSNKVTSFTYSIFSPFQIWLGKTIKQIKYSWDFLNHLKEIQQENYILKQEIGALMGENTRLKELEKENKLLKSFLAIPEHQRSPIVLANIIGKDFLGTEKYILLDKGRADGVKENFPVIVYDNILVGKITQVFDNFSKAILISSPNCKVPVIIQENRTEGLLEGEAKDGLVLNLIPKGKKIEVDQTVITSGIEGIYPKGLLIGKISKVEVPEKEMFQKIRIKPVVEIEAIERVLIIKSVKQENK